jgi:hypothetical protein
MTDIDRARVLLLDLENKLKDLNLEELNDILVVNQNKGDGSFCEKTWTMLRDILKDVKKVQHELLRFNRQGYHD